MTVWYASAESIGYTTNLADADPWDVTRKHTAADWVLAGEAPDMTEALALYDRLNPRGLRSDMTNPFRPDPATEAHADAPMTDPHGDNEPCRVCGVIHAGSSSWCPDSSPAAQEAVTVVHGPDYNTEVYPAQSPIADPAPPPAEPTPPAWMQTSEQTNLDAVLQDGPPKINVGGRVGPTLHPLPRIDVPDHQSYYPHISAWLATGASARNAAAGTLQPGSTVAVDTETMSLGADGFTVKCFTAAWETANGTVSVLLDPTRRDDDRATVRDILEMAGAIVIQNAAYDVPILYQNGWMTLDQVSKVHDTAVYARMAFPDRAVSKSLEYLAPTFAGFPDAEIKMSEVFKAAGYPTQSEGFKAMDIDRPIYRLGAMADTVATLRLLPQIQAKAWSQLVEGHPFGDRGVDSDGAVALMEREQRVNRIMLRRSALGLEVDTDYLERYGEAHIKEMTAARDALAAEDIDPDAGNLGFLLVTKLEAKGQLPADWPRTESGRLRATKDDLPKLDHPLVAAARRVSELVKVQGYLTKVSDMVKVTGRVHPQVSILGASTTGRMSYSWPELQQFPADARPIIVCETGLTSVDWSQIEPVIMANCAGDMEFLAPFEAGADLYGPIQAAAGIDRKVAKVLLLAAMYGQGRAAVAADLGITADQAKVLQDGMFSAMPTTKQFMDQIRQIADQHGKIITASGRVVPVPKDPTTRKTLAYKAVNYFCQGSAYDVLADTLIRMEDAGLADSVHLALHDELVVDTEAAEATAEIMRTPPGFLGKWTGGRTPVFKTDTNDMGRTWLYV
ncbi:DNA polymerase I [Gordonia phage Upyo]|nr:DNA polymerase I [Gordonia phage Upyo]